MRSEGPHTYRGTVMLIFIFPLQKIPRPCVRLSEYKELKPFVFSLNNFVTANSTESARLPPCWSESSPFSHPAEGWRRGAPPLGCWSSPASSSWPSGPPFWSLQVGLMMIIIQCCGRTVQSCWHLPLHLPVLRIRDVYPGSRILIFTHPGSRISDPKTAMKDRGEKN